MTQYFVIDLEELAPGRKNSQRHDCCHAVQEQVGKQSALQPWQITAARPNMPPVFDQDDKVIETGVTSTKILYSGDFIEAELEHTNIVAIVTDELKVGVATVTSKIGLDILTHEQVLTMLHDNAEEWGEVTG